MATAEETLMIDIPCRSHRPTDWTAMANGEWWLVHQSDGTDRVADVRAFDRIKRSTSRWARRNGYQRETRRRESCRLVWVRFTKNTEGAQ